MKGLVLLGMLRFRRFELDGLTDGIIYASMVGLGFAMSENVSYYLAALNSEAGGVGLAVTVVLRGILSPFAHPLFTSMIGVAVAFAAQRHGPERTFSIMAQLVGRDDPARPLERARLVRRLPRAGRRLPGADGGARGADRRRGPRPAPHRRADPALPAAVRADQAGDQGRHPHALGAAPAQARPPVGPHVRRQERAARDERLPTRRDRAGAAARARRPAHGGRADLPRGAAGPAGVHEHRPRRVPGAARARSARPVTRPAELREGRTNAAKGASRRWGEWRTSHPKA
ncbi:PrsW family glutamic-type intramembrane protease [Nonomuraea ferruginea]